MPSNAIPGFVKKRTASERYDRSSRQLTRDITLAIEMGDHAMLTHLKVRTEDGDIIDGTDVTADSMKMLRENGRNPMWYLETTWLEENFGKRADTTKHEARESDAVSPPTADGETSETMTEMLKETVQELKADKAHLIQQLQFKDDQIEAANQRWGETNVLLKSLQDKLALPRADSAATPSNNQAESEPFSSAHVTPVDVPETPKTAKQPSKQRTRKKARPATKRKTQSKQPTTGQKRPATKGKRVSTKSSAKKVVRKNTPKSPQTLGQRISRLFR